jgi:hypothetical protein
LTEDGFIIWIGANELAADGNSENNAKFTASGNPLGTFFNGKYYFVINKTIDIMVDFSVLYTIQLFIFGVKIIIHTRMILMLENTDC